MKILLIGPLPPPVNGCSYANLVFARRAEDAGHVVFCVNTSASALSGNQGSKFSLKKAMRFVRTYRFLTRILGADVLYLTPGQTLFGVLKYAPFMTVARLCRRPYVFHVHGNHLGTQYKRLSGWQQKLMKHYVSGASAGIALSESLRENFADLLPPERVHVVENFAGDELFTNSLASKERHVMSILYLSNLMREKGVYDLLDALLILKRNGVHFRCILAGGIEDGGRDELDLRLASLSPEVSYLGPVHGAAKVEILARSNVFVLPTYYTMEGQPISILEAMAAGNIIVTTPHAGIPDVIDETCGYLVPARDPLALAVTLTALSRNIEHQLEKFSDHNVRLARGRFTEAAFRDNLIRVLASAININRGTAK